MLDFLLFDDAKLGCDHRDSKKKHFTRLAKQKASFFSLEDTLQIYTLFQTGERNASFFFTF